MLVSSYYKLKNPHLLKEAFGVNPGHPGGSPWGWFNSPLENQRCASRQTHPCFSPYWHVWLRNMNFPYALIFTEKESVLLLMSGRTSFPSNFIKTSLALSYTFIHVTKLGPGSLSSLDSMYTLMRAVSERPSRHMGGRPSDLKGTLFIFNPGHGGLKAVLHGRRNIG